MKTTTSNTLQSEKMLRVLSKGELLLIKFTIGLFGFILNVCFIELIF